MKYVQHACRCMVTCYMYLNDGLRQTQLLERIGDGIMGGAL